VYLKAGGIISESENEEEKMAKAAKKMKKSG